MLLFGVAFGRGLEEVKMAKTFFFSSILAATTAFGDIAGLGYRITNCVYDVFGVDISFATTNEPPYLVGVFVAEEAGFSRRVRPIRTKLVGEKWASLSGKFYDRGNVFIQVFDASVTNEPGYGVMTESERTAYFDRLHSRLDGSRALAAPYDAWSDRYGEENMQLVGDHTWGSFKPSGSSEITVSAAGRKSVPDLPVECPPGHLVVCDGNDFARTNMVFSAVAESASERETSGSPFVHGWYYRHPGDPVDVYTYTNGTYETVLRYVFYNPHFPDEAGHIRGRVTSVVEAAEQTLCGFDASVGLGYRLILDERTLSFTAERAFSLFGDRSQEVVLRRPVRALSVRGGKKVVLDWLGFMRFAEETNAVPGRIYWEGL